MMEQKDIDERIEELGQLVDKCDNLLSATKLPFKPEAHVEGLTAGIAEMRQEILESYVALGGEDVWGL